MATPSELAREVRDHGVYDDNGKLRPLDIQTASAMLVVYDALSPENQAKFDQLPLERAASVAWKLVK